MPNKKASNETSRLSKKLVKKMEQSIANSRGCMSDETNPYKCSVFSTIRTKTGQNFDEMAVMQWFFVFLIFKNLISNILQIYDLTTFFPARP